MAKPLLPEWDLNRTHCTDPTASHKSDGFVTDEVPASDIENAWRNSVYRNFAYVRDRKIFDAIEHLVPMLDPTNLDAKDPEFPSQSPSADCIYALALHGGQAYLHQGSTNAKVKIMPGVLMQLRGGQIYSYQFDGTDEVTIPDGDATNPRVDLIQMKLDVVDDTGLASLTLSVKQGTPAANPVYPAPDTDYCVVGAIVVGATWAGATGLVYGEDSAGAVIVLHDQRFPIGVRCHKLMPIDSMFNEDELGGDYGLPTGKQWIEKKNNLGGAVLSFPLRESSDVCRLLLVKASILNTVQQDSRITLLKYRDAGDSTNISMSYVDLAHAGVDGSATFTFINRTGGKLGFQRSTSSFTGPMFAFGPTIVANANGMGPPIWTNGRRCASPPVEDGSETIPGSTGVNILALCFPAVGTSDQGTKWGPVTFYTCEGL